MLNNIIYLVLRYGRHLNGCELLANGGMGSTCTCGLIADLKTAMEQEGEKQA